MHTQTIIECMWYLLSCTVWFSTAFLPEKCTVPFLPVNPQLSSTRNQGRQKLARFTPKEFTTLIVDLLVEANRRHMLANNAPQSMLFINK